MQDRSIYVRLCGVGIFTSEEDHHLSTFQRSELVRIRAGLSEQATNRQLFVMKQLDRLDGTPCVGLSVHCKSDIFELLLDSLKIAASS